MKVRIVSITEPVIEGVLTPEDFVIYCARVSNPSNQSNTQTSPRLLKYLVEHKHWSPFEMVSLTIEIKTSRAIAAQILRHRSFSFQEFSQRYSAATEFEPFQIRVQSEKNRQSSTDVMPLEEEDLNKITNHLIETAKLYDSLLEKGAAKESARMILPLCTQTTLYMSGTLRSWIHYLELRSKEDTQLEHREIAIDIKNELSNIFPNISEALQWNPLPKEETK